jgi:hypothetical protein
LWLDWDILQQLRADRRTSHISVHVISITDGEDRASVAAVRFLQKPVSEEQLRAELAYRRRDAPIPTERIPQRRGIDGRARHRITLALDRW